MGQFTRMTLCLPTGLDQCGCPPPQGISHDSIIQSLQPEKRAVRNASSHRGWTTATEAVDNLPLPPAPSFADQAHCVDRRHDVPMEPRGGEPDPVHRILQRVIV